MATVNQEVMIDQITIITHGIKGMPHHYWTGDGIYQMSHCVNKRTLPQKLIRPILNGRCVGFKIHGRFVSRYSLLKKLFPLNKIIVQPDNSCPF